MEMDINLMERKVKPYYRLVGFHLDECGNQVSALHAPCFVQDSFLIHFAKVSLVIPLVFVWVWREV